MKEDNFTECLSYAVEGKQIWKPITNCWFNEVFKIANILDQIREINQQRSYEIMQHIFKQHIQTI